MITAIAVVQFLRFLAILAREIVLASISVAKLALGPLDRLRSGFIAVPLDARSDLEITVFANSITLTPGTITVHVDRARRTLVMHAIDIGRDPEELRRSTKDVLEASILRWTRAGRRARRRRR
jgi:multicomponent Na+:H+ antiporter subunit E